jgi:hypothetical protein
MARPTKLTPEITLGISESLRRGMTITGACQREGISRETYYNWLEESPEFFDTIKRSESEAEELFTDTIISAATDPSFGCTWQAAAWWLERRRKADYGKDDRPDPDAPKDAAVILIPDNSR